MAALPPAHQSGTATVLHADLLTKLDCFAAKGIPDFQQTHLGAA